LTAAAEKSAAEISQLTTTAEKSAAEISQLTAAAEKSAAEISHSTAAAEKSVTNAYPKRFGRQPVEDATDDSLSLDFLDGNDSSSRSPKSGDVSGSDNGDTIVGGQQQIQKYFSQGAVVAAVQQASIASASSGSNAAMPMPAGHRRVARKTVLTHERPCTKIKFCSRMTNPKTGKHSGYCSMTPPNEGNDLSQVESVCITTYNNPTYDYNHTKSVFWLVFRIRLRRIS
jgi:hypothetical protein